MAWFGRRPSLRSAMAIGAAVVLAGLGGEGRAETGLQLATLSIVDRDTGQELHIWRHHGRLFVAGQPGERYSLRVTNNGEGRVLAVMAVDGVNIVTGETAGYDQRGYVLSAHQSLDVTGWRKSETEVAGFNFAPLPQSYAARTARPLDVGVIGMAVFEERPQDTPPAPTVSQATERSRRSSIPHRPPPIAMPAPPLPLPPVRAPIPRTSVPEALAPAPPAPPAPIPPASEARASSASPRFAALQGEKLGTAHGAREWSVVEIVEFERATPYPEFIQQIEYDSYANLAASGVIPRGPTTDGHPRSFPSVRGVAGYVPDPPQDP